MHLALRIQKALPIVMIQMSLILLKECQEEDHSCAMNLIVQVIEQPGA
jgi:hypothetical protein